MTDQKHEAVARAIAAALNKPDWWGSYLNVAEAAIAAYEAVTAESGMVMAPRDVVEFLRGAGPLDGVWFGDKHWEKPGTFWWRCHLPAPPAVKEPGA